AVNIEAYPGGCDNIKPERGILTHANHFTANTNLNALEDSPRGERLAFLLEEKHGLVSTDYLKKCMSDHKNYPKAICRHPADVSIPLSRRSMTVSSMIIDLSESIVHICAGPPCEGEFVQLALY
ncbi:MAG: acyl-CoA--6-aminopenicillanic acid acyltransferase, partial [Clostridiales bacterium]|nr:acyl-CoA--6-aminopenicillanic acid acyltransferase [Clostridiales bacterium]